MSEERRTLLTIPPPTGVGKTVVVYDTDSASDLFADGVANIMLGASVSKINFTRTIMSAEGSESLEEREVAFRLTMTTKTLMQFCHNVIQQVQAHKEPIAKAIDIEQKELLTLFAALQGPEK